MSRELRRNRIRGRYNYVRADEISAERRHKASTQLKKIKDQLEILKGLYSLWSPEQISGRLKKEGISVSHEAIYQYAKKNGLQKNLRHGGKKYKRKNTAKSGGYCIQNRTDISERPKIVEEKGRIGDSHGSHCALLTLVDRCSKYTIIRKIGRKTFENLSAAIINSLKKEGLPIQLRLIMDLRNISEYQRS